MRGSKLGALLALLALFVGLTPAEGQYTRRLGRAATWQPGFRYLTAVAPGPGALISSVNPDGWSAVPVSLSALTFQPDTAPQTVSFDCPGFTSTGAPTTVPESFVITKQVRQPWPNDALLDANRVALSDYPYQGCQSAGVTNSASLKSPAPIVDWISTDHRVVGNSVTPQLLAFHRNARAQKQVAAVVLTATDGSTTSSCTTSTMADLTKATDKNVVYGYTCTLDLSGMADGATITVNGKVSPHLGDADSIADSSTGTANARGFVPQIYLRSTAKAANPPFAYVGPSGSGCADATVDAAGVGGGVTKVSTSATTAKAGCFLTIQSAIQALQKATSVTAGVVDGAIIRIFTTTASMSANVAAGTYQGVGELLIEGDPATARSGNAFSFGTTAYQMRTPFVRWRNLTMTRTGAVTIASGLTKTTLEDVVLDNAGYNGQIAPALAIDGATITNSAASVLAAGALEMRMIRGVSVTGGNVEGWLVLGSSFTSPAAIQSGSRSLSGGIYAFNQARLLTASSIWMALGASADVNGYAIVQSLFEYVSATTAAVERITGDSDAGNVRGILNFQNTFAGAYQAGRRNVYYEDGPTSRASEQVSDVGNIYVATYTKSDQFRGANQSNPEGFTSANPSTRTRNWGVLYGAGFRAQFTQSQSNTPLGGNEAQVYPGLAAKMGTSQSVPNSPSFVLNAATTYNGSTYTAGAGGGDYHLQPGSAALGMVASSLLPGGLDGAARPLTGDRAGAY